jgi:heme oxygenase (mycobilin-producing)
MNIYITAGTFNFLKKLELSYPKEKLITMLNENGAILYHESNGDTVFKQPRRYQLLESAGDIQKEGFVVMNNIPVTDEGRPLFEHQVKNHLGRVRNADGFKAFRLLRPSTSNTYVIMTVWKNEISYQKMQGSNPLFSSDLNKDFSGGKGLKIFESAPYTSRYTITE